MLARYLFLPAVCLVVWGQLQQGAMPPGPEVSDKLLHFTAYFGLAGMATVALDGNRRALMALLALIAMGGIMEILQGLTGRDAEWLDQLANTVGVVLGGAAGMVWTYLVAARAPLAGGQGGS